ncbi:Autophagy-related protein 13 [Nakaseomyces bracarensis]|uniref:Autophagy-related protein 13 n=1 Tax=Nakaseomyces bracarensis TaxID=273131 RepID=A0ABR4NZN3_9SACH
MNEIHDIENESSINDQSVIDLIQNFFMKSAGLVTLIESKGNPLDETPVNFDDEWFDMNIDMVHELPKIIDTWSHYDGKHDLPPLVIETYLDLRQLTANYTVRVRDKEGHLWTVTKGTKKTEVVLERWLIELDNESPSFKNNVQAQANSDARKIDQQITLLFRYLYTLLQLLPSNDLQLDLVKQSESQSSPIPVEVKTRILDGSKPILSKGRIGLSRPIISTYSNTINESNLPPHLDQKKITPVWTKFGLLRISVSYRRDSEFIIQDNDEYLATPQPQVINNNTRRSMSLSPCSKSHTINSSEPSWQKKFLSSTKQFQPFIVGSVGSTNISHINSRNESNASVIPHGPSNRRSSVGSSNSVSIQPGYEGTSVGTTSRFASSFSNIRRHSNMRTNDNGDKIIKGPTETPEDVDDLMEFVRLIDEKPPLKPKKGVSSSLQNKNLSGSLLKFQKLRPSNDMLSEDLAMSISIDPVHGQRRSSNSHSHSPIASYSPSGHYSSLNSKLSNLHLPARDSSSSVNSRRNSVDRLMTGALPPVFDGDNSYNDKSSDMMSYRLQDQESEGNDDLLVNQVPINNRFKTSTSPRSIDSISNSITKNRVPFKHSFQYSQPTTIATQAHAKLHRPNVRSTDMINEITHKKTDNFHQVMNDNDEDDMVFFMSDMNLSREH